MNLAAVDGAASNEMKGEGVFVLESVMPRFLTAALLLSLAVLLVPPSSFAQDEGGNKEKKEEKPKVKPLPDDKKLLSLHLDFVKKAEKL